MWRLLAGIGCQLQSHDWQPHTEATWLGGVVRESITCVRCGVAQPDSTRLIRRAAT